MQWEHARNQSQLATLKVEVEQAKSEHAEEKSWMSTYRKEMEELRLTAKIQKDRQYRAEEKQQKAESERK